MDFVRKTIRTNCKYCRKPFDSFALSKVCQNCQKEAEKTFEKIDKILKEKPASTSDDICNELNISRDYIKRYYSEPREVATNTQFEETVLCEVCLTPIESGRFCSSCKQKIDEDFKKRTKRI